MPTRRKKDWRNQIKRPRQTKYEMLKNGASEVREKVDLLSRALISLEERMEGAQAGGKVAHAPIALTEQTRNV